MVCNIEGSFDWRNRSTLRINFDSPVGLDACGFVDEDDQKEFTEQFANLTTEQVTDAINTEIINFFDDNEADIDWRDAYEVEVHNLIKHDFDELDLMSNINTTLTKYLS